MRNTLHQAAVADKGIGVVIDDRVSITVERARQHLFSDRHANCVGEALPEGAGRGLHTRRIAVLRVTRRLGVQLTEVFQVLDAQVVAAQVQQRVDQHRAVAVGEHETVAIGPFGVGRIVLEEVVPQHFGDIGHAHGGARMARFGLLDGIHAEGANGVGKFTAGGHGVSPKIL